MIILAKHKATFGLPCGGETCDIWSLKSCRESYGCLRGSFVLDGDMLDAVLGTTGHGGQLVDMCPIMSFARFAENRHTGAALARWKREQFKAWGLEQVFGLATEDGASNNKAANRILSLPAIVCGPHDVARAVHIGFFGPYLVQSEHFGTITGSYRAPHSITGTLLELSS